jgi:hypothetical protein
MADLNAVIKRFNATTNAHNPSRKARTHAHAGNTHFATNPKVVLSKSIHAPFPLYSVL